MAGMPLQVAFMPGTRIINRKYDVNHTRIRIIVARFLEEDP
jgi:hypothetical protein